MQIRSFDFHKEDPEQLWTLFREVYGTDTNARNRWTWEVEQHPLKDDIRIHVAEENAKILGMTIRLPAHLVTADRLHRAEFAVNTMVHPDFRRHGLVKALYAHAIALGNLQLSKGTMPAMARQLEKMGYREITAAKTFVFLLAPMRWLYQKITKRQAAPICIQPVRLQTEYDSIEKFTSASEEVCCGATLSVTRSAELLNWRYRAIPHRQYACYARTVGSETVAWFILRFGRTTAYLIDLSFIPEKENVHNLVRAAVQTARACGAIKMVYWGTLNSVNREIIRQGGWERPAIPQFRFISRDPTWDTFDWENAHFVQGDGDYDYL